MHSFAEWRGNLGLFSMRSSFVLLHFPRAWHPIFNWSRSRDAISIRNPKSQIGTRNYSRSHSLPPKFSQHEFAIFDLRCVSILNSSCVSCLTSRNNASEESVKEGGDLLCFPRKSTPCFWGGKLFESGAAAALRGIDAACPKVSKYYNTGTAIAVVENGLQ